ncbi:twin-arginine translocation signal domain-containing protein [Halorussus halophilus]|uniref:twin-arginine translocation signal domain-containing protein n=1 Tax=Halorussus halophilus TaxID=2650975 RepID=UPI0013018BF3|nr:twin-arginine translocation signal domain-containing protein [Halorussus halophilus]
MNANRRQFLKRSAVATVGATTLVGASGTAAAYDVPLVSTRGHCSDDGSLKSGVSQYSYETNGLVPGIDTSCVSDLTVFIHGWDKKSSSSSDAEQDARDKIQQAETELTGSGYDGTVVGYTWDNDVGGGADYGWGEAQTAAQNNGLKLAQFAVDLKYYCPNVSLRFASHSLGAQVLLSSLRSLDVTSWWDDQGHEVYSTHLLGAAQDNEAPTQEWMDTYNAVTNEVTSQFNYHNHEDDVLQWVYNTIEFDQALGETGYEDGNTPAPNHHELDVTSQVGDDHSGYLSNVSDEVVYHMENTSAYV